MKKLLKKIVLIVCFAVLTPKLYAQLSVGLSVHIGPPSLPVYMQPACPADGYIWTPGYWAYGDNGYFWVPGVWVRPPHYGLLWTPAYWGYEGGEYGFHTGYWASHVGFYGGINYGFGYSGLGFGGGVWAGNTFRYNTAVTNVNTTVVHNTYINNTVINNTTVNNNRASFNGPGGVNSRPNRDEQMAMRDQHVQATSQQLTHQQNAAHDRSQFASVNNGRPATTAMNQVNGRRFDQQGRIANGVSSGRLTPGETKNLENRESNINQQVRADRNNNGGQLTPQERQQMNNQQNNVNNSIYTDKHNANNTQYGNNEVGQRKANQQQRIANGIDNGQMSPQGAAHAENRQQNINRQINIDRRANGGGLNQHQHQQVNRQQNQAGRQLPHEHEHRDNF